MGPMTMRSGLDGPRLEVMERQLKAAQAHKTG